MLPDEPNDEERQEKLPEDGETPFRPADPELDDTDRTSEGGAVTQQLDDTHPVTDTDMQPGDEYGEGIANAAGVGSRPDKGTVLSYKGVPNSMADDDADIGPPTEQINEEDQDNQTNMEEV